MRLARLSCAIPGCLRHFASACFLLANGSGVRGVAYHPLFLIGDPGFGFWVSRESQGLGKPPGGIGPQFENAPFSPLAGGFPKCGETSWDPEALWRLSQEDLSDSVFLGCGVKTNGIPFWGIGEFTAHVRKPILVVGVV